MYDRIERGEISAIDAYIELYEQKKALEEQIEHIKELAILERERYGKEQIKRKGYEVELMSGRKVWSYKGVSTWESLKDRMKDVEKMAQHVATKGVEIIDVETGEVIQPASLSFTRDSIKLTYKGE